MRKEKDITNTRRFWGATGLAAMSYAGAAVMGYGSQTELYSNSFWVNLSIGIFATGTALGGVHYTAVAKEHYSKIDEKSMIFHA